jgi:hypothetical protein
LDFDDVRDPYTGEINPAVEQIIRRLETVVCISSSGKGLHVFVRQRAGSELPAGTKITNLDYSGDVKQSEIKKPGTFVALTFKSLPGYSAIEKTVQPLIEDVEHLLFGDNHTISHPPGARTGDTASEAQPDTLEGSAARLHGRFFKGYTNGGYIWRLLRFIGNQTKPFQDTPGLLTDHSQWNILVLSDYWQYVSGPSHKEAEQLSKAYEKHWLDCSPYNRGHQLKPDSWHKNQAAVQCDYAKDKVRARRSAVSHPDTVIGAVMKIIQESSNPLLTRNELLLLGAVTRQVLHQSDTCVKISISEMASLTQMYPSAVSAAKKLIASKNLPWLEIDNKSRTTVYRVVLE